MMIKISTLLRAVISISLLLASAATQAENALFDFSESLKSFRANFTQTVYDADSVVLQESTGVVVLARPGRFKWTYEAPINQVIVADGLTLWVYDEEIKQVTKQPQSTTLGSAPIGLLSGQRDIASEFAITELGMKDDLEWFQLQPLVSDTDFNEIFIALSSGALHAMELRDNFDQATQIVFSNFEKNISLDSEQFNFVVPAGVDVVGEGGVAENQDELLIDESNPEQGESDITEPALIENNGDAPSQSQQSDTAAPAGLSSTTDAPSLSDPLLVNDSDPLLEDTSPIEQQDDVNSARPLTSGTRDPDPNSDEELLNDVLPSVDPAAQTDSDITKQSDDQTSSVEDSSTPLVTEPASDVPQIDMADPNREITFEERKVTD